MSSVEVSAIVFVCALGGALSSIFLSWALPRHPSN